ncbi:ribonuclease H2 subunit B, partial [Paragonimus westermani]
KLVSAFGGCSLMRYAHPRSEGSLYLCTLFDPLFLFINLLMAKNRYTTLTSLLMDKASLSNLLSHQDLLEKRLDDICDTKTFREQKLYLYNSERTLTWLCGRVAQVATGISNLENHSAVQQVRQHVSFDGINVSVSVVPEFTADSSEAGLLLNTLSSDTCLRFAYQMIADYLPSALATTLADRLGFWVSGESNVGAISSGGVENINPTNLKAAPAQFVGAQPNEDYSNTLKTNDSTKSVDPTSAKKRRSVKGMQSLMNFFTRAST